MKILALVKSTNACDYHRIMMPLQHMQMEKEDVAIMVDHNQTLFVQDFKGVDIVFFNREPPFSLEKIIELRDIAKFKIVCDLDDYWKLYTHHYLYSEWTKNKTEEKLISTILAADAVITTNNRLADRVKSYNPNVYVVPNALPFDNQKDQFTDTTTDSDKVRIIFAGGISHYFDLRAVSGLFEKAKSDVDLRSHAKFILAGYSDKGKNKIGIKMENLFKRTGNYETRPVLPLDRYMDHYSNADIAIAPLDNNNFNAFKSNLKVLEAGCKKIPILTSRMYPYLQDEEAHITQGLYLCERPQDWYDTLRYLVKNREQIAQKGYELGQYVRRRYHLDNWNRVRYNIFKSIIEKNE